jgi:hypothetical protein
LGETRVDLLHLLEDLRDAYPGALEETILTEIVANSLDSGATVLSIVTDPAAATLVVIDDGKGMARRELARYHDVAASSKTRGQGIGFAGVGIKLGLLASEEVVTETRRGKSHVATTWRLASRHRAPWRWMPPPGMVAQHGTAVRLKLHNPLSPLLEAGFVEGVLRRHFQPLFEPGFDELLSLHYPRGARFLVNGGLLERQAPPRERAGLAVRIGRKRKPSAVGYLARDGGPVPEEQRGLGISTLGKVIKRGWDWLGMSPSAPERLTGLIEVPALSESLTLNKADFIRTGSRGALYLAYRKAIQEAVAAQLAAWGDAPDTAEEARRRKARPLERDLQTVLVDLADEFPLLATLVERRPGGQRRLPMGRPDGPEADAVVPVPAEAVPSAEAAPGISAQGGPETRDDALPPFEPLEPPSALPDEPEPSAGEAGEPPLPAAELSMPGRRGPKRPARYGLTIQFETRPDDLAMGRLVESTVWVNDAHPAYVRAVASRSEGYHIALAVAMALAPLTVEPPHLQSFLNAFLARWGEALQGRTRPRRRRS